MGKILNLVSDFANFMKNVINYFAVEKHSRIILI